MMNCALSHIVTNMFLLCDMTFLLSWGMERTEFSAQKNGVELLGLTGGV